MASPAVGFTDAAPAPDETEKRKRSTKNLVLRAFSALAALAVLYFCLRWDVVNNSGFAWAGLIAASTIPCLREFHRLARGSGIEPFRSVGYIAAPLYVLCQEVDLSGAAAEWLPVSSAWAVLVAACVAAMLLQLTRKNNDDALSAVAMTLWGIGYCAVLPGLTVHLRHLEFDAGGWQMQGIEFAVVCIFVAKVSDVGALLTGSRWGRHKLIPRLSPGKTWEGALGGLLFSIGLLQFMAWTNPAMALARLGWPLLVLLSFLLAAGGLAGDLIESAFKRGSRRKDAGTGVPGFGGMLDLVDSLMVATPVMYFFLLLCGAGYSR
jgi:phosphatidate cytidylyltransferase